MSTRRRADDLETDAGDESEAAEPEVEEEAEAMEDDGKTETPLHIQMVLEVRIGVEFLSEANKRLQ